MKIETAKGLIRTAIRPGACWADLGAGSGTFSYALSELLGPLGMVIAVDRKQGFSLESTGKKNAQIHHFEADFTHSLNLPPLNGILMANSLHFIHQQKEVLQKWIHKFLPEGHIILVEYDRVIPSPWVPYPISREKGKKLLEDLGFEGIKEIGSTPSQYQNGDIYALWARIDRED